LRFLEAVVNEVFDDAADGHPGYVDALSSEARLELSNLWSEKCTEAKRWAPLEKFQAALRCCSTEVFNKGALPYQDAKLLMNLRNELVHARPETVSSSDKDQSQRRGQMNSKFRPNRLMENSGNAYFPDHCLGAGCAAWAVKSARAFADDFFARTKIKPNYQRVDFGPE
jgi:hypothetical protein